MTKDIRENRFRDVFGAQEDRIEHVQARWKQLQVLSTRRQQQLLLTTRNMVDEQQQRKIIDNVQLVLWLVGGLATSLLVTRIALMVVTTQVGTPLSQLIMEATSVLLWPFAALSETYSSPNIALLERSSLTAVIVYPFVIWCLSRLLQQATVSLKPQKRRRL